MAMEMNLRVSTLPGLLASGIDITLRANLLGPEKRAESLDSFNYRPTGGEYSALDSESNNITLPSQKMNVDMDVREIISSGDFGKNNTVGLSFSGKETENLQPFHGTGTYREMTNNSVRNSGSGFISSGSNTYV